MNLGGVLARGKAVLQTLQGREKGAVATYMRGESTPFFFNWRPALRDGQDDVRASYTLAAARAIDTIQNSGWIAGGVQQAIAALIGPGLRLNPRPDTTLVKFDGLKDDDGEPIDVDGWSRFVKRRWQAWSMNPRECDKVGRQTVPQMTKSALMQWFRTGEIVALLPYKREPGITTGTKVLLMQSTRLSQKTDTLTRLVQGVRMDDAGRPASYVFEMRNPAQGTAWQEFQARDGAGRQQVVHIFDGGPGEVRGITPLVAALHVIRQYDQLADATLTAALIQAIFAATVESEVPTSDFLASLQSGTEQGLGGNLEALLAAAVGWKSSTTFDLGQNGKINHLFPGEKLKFNRSEHPNSTYEPFSKFLLREIARCLGVTFEQLTGDYTGATYSSVRMSTAETWQITLARRQNIAAPFVQPIYEAWLEEEIEEGRIKFPGGIEGFLKLRSAACRADWKGPPKPEADEIKTAKKHQLYKNMALMTDESIANDLGMDVDDIYEDLQRERKLREKFGIFIVPSPAMNGIPGAPPDDPEDEDPDDIDTPIVPVPVKPNPGK